MGFEVIPALDVSGGRLAGIRDGEPTALAAFGGDPAAAARAFREAGASWIHVVDVDRALSGAPRDLATLRAVAGSGVRIQASGGIRSRADVEDVLAAGAARAVLGSGVLTDRDELERTLDALGDAVVVGIEVSAGAIQPRGERGAELPLHETLTWLRGLPLARTLCTAVARVGGLEGPELATVGVVAGVTQRPVLVAGGIRGAEDLRRLAGSGLGLEGAVIGRALYEGLDLRRAREAVEGV